MFEQNKPRLAELAKSFLNSVLAGQFPALRKGLALCNPTLLSLGIIRNLSVTSDAEAPPAAAFIVFHC